MTEKWGEFAPPTRLWRVWGKPLTALYYIGPPVVHIEVMEKLPSG